MRVDQALAAEYAAHVLEDGYPLWGWVRDAIGSTEGSYEVTARFAVNDDGRWGDARDPGEENFVPDSQSSRGYRVDHTVPVRRLVTAIGSPRDVLLVANSFHDERRPPLMIEGSDLRVVQRLSGSRYETYFLVPLPATDEDVNVGVRNSWGMENALGIVTGAHDGALPADGDLVSEEELRALASPLKMVFMRRGSYDGYLVWRPADGEGTSSARSRQG